MKTIYLASAFTERYWCRVVEPIVRQLGHRVVSQWHELKEADGNNEEWAGICQEDIRASDLFILFVAGQSQGGCWTEMGIAIACGIPVVIVGETNNIFQYLPNVRVCREQEWLTYV